MEKYILLYGDKKPEDNICITNMFKNNIQINLGWTDFDYNKNINIIEEYIKKDVKQIIFSGLEIGWDRLVTYIKEKHENIKVKVICNTLDSLLYYDYERTNFFKMLELSKKKLIDNIGFLRKGQYEVYKQLGYKCSYIKENFILEEKIKVENTNNKVNIGIYPLNYTWDKNIFNQLCIAKYIDNSNLNYNEIDERMKDFVDTMKIKATSDKIEKIEEKNIKEKIIKNNINIATSFTEYFHTIFWISMEQGIPCIIGNTSDLFDEDEELRKYIVTEAEDNSIINSELVKKCLANSKKIIELYKIWKEKYNVQAKKSIIEFIES